MAWPSYLREKAREMRVERKLSIDEIAELLAVSRSTVYHWVRDLELGRPRQNPGQALGAASMSTKCRMLREEAYAEGLREFDRLAQIESFRDFVCMYIGEGYKRNRNTVSICNSDPAVVLLGVRWITGLTENKVGYAIQFHADQDLVELIRFWAGHLGIGADQIKLQRKSNSQQLRKRTWRSEHGVMTVRVGDTLLRARLQAWMDLVRASWADEIASQVDLVEAV